MTQIDDLALKAQAAKSAQDTVARLAGPADASIRFQSSPDGVFWGRALGNVPGAMSRADRGGLLFHCENSQAVADQLNAVMDAAIATKVADDLASAHAALDAATQDLAVMLAPDAQAAVVADVAVLKTL